MTTDPRSVVVDWTDALNRHDPDAAAAYLSDDCVFDNVGTGEHFEGREAVHNEYEDLLARWGDLHIESTNIFVSEDGQFVKEWIMTGVHSGDMPGLPATGRRFRMRGAGVGQIQDGKIRSQTEYPNLIGFLEQVGAVPQPTP